MATETLESILRLFLHARNSHGSLRSETRARAHQTVAAIRIARAA